MRKLIVTLLLLPLCVEAVQLQLKNQIYRGQAPVLVKDLFIVSGDNAETIGELPISWQNANGWNNTQGLLPNTLVNDYGIEFNGSNKVWLSICQPIDLEALSIQLKAQLQQSFNADYVKVVNFEPLSDSVKCLALDSQIAEANVQTNGRFSSRVSSTIRLNDHNTMQLWWQVEYSVFAPVASNTIENTETLSPKSIEYQWRAPEPSEADYIIEDAQLSKWQAKKRIAKNQGISRNNAMLIPDINKGDSVTVMLHNQGIQIQSMAKALNSGNINDEIMVLVDTATSPVKGKIINKGVVYATY